MDKRYGIEIYQAGSLRDVRITFEFDTPPMLPRIGDTMTTAGWPDEQHGEYLEVVHVTHVVWEGPQGQSKQKAMIYTKRVRAEEISQIVTASRRG